MSEISNMEKNLQTLFLATHRAPEHRDTPLISADKKSRTDISSRGAKQRLKRIISDRKPTEDDYSQDRISDKTMKKRGEKSNSRLDTEGAICHTKSKPSKKNILVPYYKKPILKNTKGKHRNDNLMSQLSYQSTSIKKMLKEVNSINNDGLGVLNSSMNIQLNKNSQPNYAHCLIKRILGSRKLVQSPTIFMLSGETSGRPRKLNSTSGFLRSNRPLSPRG